MIASPVAPRVIVVPHWLTIFPPSEACNAFDLTTFPGTATLVVHLPTDKVVPHCGSIVFTSTLLIIRLPTFRLL